MSIVRPVELASGSLPSQNESCEDDREDVALLKHANEGFDCKPSQTEEGMATDVLMTPVSPADISSMRLRRLAGLGYIVFGALNISLMSTCVKYATHYVTSHEAVFWRSLLSFGFNLILVRWNKVNLSISFEHRKLLLMRCFFGTMSICFQFYAMSKMVLTDAVMIIFTSPVITFALGAIVLREKIDRIDFSAAIFSYFGVLFVTRPAFLFQSVGNATHDSGRTDGILSAMAAAVCQACAYIVMRKLHDVHHMASIHYFSGFGIFFSIAMLLVFHAPLRIPSLWSVRFALIAAAFFACIGLLSITIGFQREKAGIASVMRYFDVIFVIIWDSVFLGEHIHRYTLLGGAIILSGASVIAYRKAKPHK